MSAAITGVVIAAIGTGYSISAGEKAKKSAKHQKERAVGRQRELDQAAAEKTAAEKRQALEQKRKRAAAYGRNVNIFGGMEGTSKNLTGQ